MSHVQPSTSKLWQSAYSYTITVTCLGESRSLDQVVQLPQSSVPRQRLEISKQILLLCLKQPAVDIISANTNNHYHHLCLMTISDLRGWSQKLPM